MLVFRELDARAVVRLFVRAAAMAGGILFVFATASSLAFSLSVQQLPALMQAALTGLAAHDGSGAFVLVAAPLMILFGTCHASCLWCAATAVGGIKVLSVSVKRFTKTIYRMIGECGANASAPPKSHHRTGAAARRHGIRQQDTE